MNKGFRSYSFYTDQLTENQRRFLKGQGCTVKIHPWMGGHTVEIENETAHAAWLLIGSDMRVVEVTEKTVDRPLRGKTADLIIVDETAPISGWVVEETESDSVWKKIKHRIG